MVKPIIISAVVALVVVMLVAQIKAHTQAVNAVFPNPM